MTGTCLKWFFVLNLCFVSYASPDGVYRVNRQDFVHNEDAGNAAAYQQSAFDSRNGVYRVQRQDFTNTNDVPFSDTYHGLYGNRFSKLYHGYVTNNGARQVPKLFAPATEKPYLAIGVPNYDRVMPISRFGNDFQQPTTAVSERGTLKPSKVHRFDDSALPAVSDRSEDDRALPAVSDFANPPSTDEDLSTMVEQFEMSDDGKTICTGGGCGSGVENKGAVSSIRRRRDIWPGSYSRSYYWQSPHDWQNPHDWHSSRDRFGFHSYSHRPYWPHSYYRAPRIWLRDYKTFDESSATFVSTSTESATTEEVTGDTVVSNYGNERVIFPVKTGSDDVGMGLLRKMVTDLGNVDDTTNDDGVSKDDDTMVHFPVKTVSDDVEENTSDVAVPIDGDARMFSEIMNSDNVDDTTNDDGVPKDDDTTVSSPVITGSDDVEENTSDVAVPADDDTRIYGEPITDYENVDDTTNNGDVWSDGDVTTTVSSADTDSENMKKANSDPFVSSNDKTNKIFIHYPRRTENNAPSSSNLSNYDDLRRSILLRLMLNEMVQILKEVNVTPQTYEMITESSNTNDDTEVSSDSVVESTIDQDETNRAAVSFDENIDNNGEEIPVEDQDNLYATSTEAEVVNPITIIDDLVFKKLVLSLFLNRTTNATEFTADTESTPYTDDFANENTDVTEYSTPETESVTDLTSGQNYDEASAGIACHYAAKPDDTEVASESVLSEYVPGEDYPEGIASEFDLVSTEYATEFASVDTVDPIYIHLDEKNSNETVPENNDNSDSVIAIGVGHFTTETQTEPDSLDMKESVDDIALSIPDPDYFEKFGEYDITTVTPTVANITIESTTAADTVSRGDIEDNGSEEIKVYWPISEDDETTSETTSETPSETTSETPIVIILNKML